MNLYYDFFFSLSLSLVIRGEVQKKKIIYQIIRNHKNQTDGKFLGREGGGGGEEEW